MTHRQFREEQHFIYQFYLRGFVITGEKSLIWEFDKTKSGFSSRPKSVRRICTRYRYYEQVDKDGRSHTDLLEKGFDKIVENTAAKLLRRIQPKGSGTTVCLAPWEQAGLAYLTATKYNSVPDFREKMEKIMRMHVDRAFDELVKCQRANGKLPL